MLRLLRIRNLAVIEFAEVEFDPGFNVLTGETGAGKSILVEAVGLLLGGRASADLVRTGEKQASIEALFEDGGREVVVRRDITTQGRSRSFVDGALATASALREMSLRLLELHGQHEHQALLDPATHLPLLDEYARLEDSAAALSRCWEEVARLRDQLDRAGMDARERDARLELVGFQLAEIERVSPKPQEDEELATVRQVLANADRLQRLCDEGYAALYDRDDSALARLSGVRKRVGALAGIEPAFAAYLTGADEAKSQLEELAYFLRDYRQKIDASPARLQEVEDRLAAIERLKRKFGPALDDVTARWHALLRERELLADTGERAAVVRQRLDDATSVYLDHARRVSRDRRAAAARLSGELIEQLAALAMDRTRFEVRFNERDLPATAWGPRGIDTAEFFVSPNPGEELRPLARIASGGELSRIMLALKTLGARPERTAATVRTVVFDEVDAGIGGQVADVVGARLADLGRTFQVLCITHLPQLAAHGTTQFRISKAVRGGRTTTKVERLAEDERVAELARMIGGATVGDAARASARELLASRGVPSGGAKAKVASGAKAKVAGRDLSGQR
ncbi:MAG TPA: DNA repair protein RecN [Vicinamibacterales bacterium]|nr:DNA repair protein RecN [Vicinamibacterales bacterium]